MSDNNNGSILDTIIIGTIVMYILYMIFLAIPIIPYFDIVLKIIFSIYIPNSFFGKIITGLVLLSIGYLMLEFAKTLGEKMFYSKEAMYFFLYAQGLIIISFMGISESNFLISKGIIVFTSLGFDEPTEIGRYYVFYFGIVALAISILIEFKIRPKQLKVIHPVKHKSLETQNDVLVYNKLQIILNAEKLLLKEKTSSFEQAIIKKAQENKELFTEEELKDIPQTMMKYKSKNT